MRSSLDARPARFVCPGSLVAVLLSIAPQAFGQEARSATDDAAAALLQEVKSAERGPFSRVRWYCADGAVLAPAAYACAGRGGGVQHGELSREALRLAAMGYHVGTLLVALPFDEFFDARHDHDRLREVVVQGYLQRVDEGWVWRRARFYRGARQAEDEEAAGRKLLSELLGKPQWVRGHFLLAMELVREVPHGQGEARLERIRLLAREIGDALPAFQPLRTKIHSYPDSSDLIAVAEFARSQSGATPGLRRQMTALASSLREYYEEDPRERIARLFESEAFREGRWKERLSAVELALAGEDPFGAIALLAAWTAQLRGEVESSADGERNLRRLDLSLALHELLVARAAAVRLSPAALREGGRRVEGSDRVSRRRALFFARSLLVASYGRGLLSARELKAQLTELAALVTASETAALDYRRSTAYLQRSAQWAHRTVESSFESVVDRYARVEPLTRWFEDDLLRGTVLLPLANLADVLGRDADRELGLTHSLFEEFEGGLTYGLNPGVASGILEYVPEAELDRAQFRPDRIYILPRSFEKLPRVAGILTISEGSSLSHLQLLARSLGIPNSVIPSRSLEVLRPHLGKEVLYVVSPLGTVLLKETSRLTREERELRSDGRELPRERLRIGGRLDLSERQVLSVDEIDLRDAERVMGPKAAGVARLRRRYPERVAPALVVPFGAFRAHLESRREPGGPSLLEELLAFYRRVAEMERAGAAGDREAFVEERLAYFREEIVRRDLDPALVEALREKLGEWGTPGSFGVFVRSDTNVEDLPEFSGAGLNLTIPHQVRFADVLDAIKRVWASPFTERAFGWRSSVLSDPEHTVVSVLIQRSVPVEKSGVLVTADLEWGRRDAVTVSAAEGFGGVVGGERAESLVIPAGGRPRLLAQARAAQRGRLRAGEEGGVEWVPTTGADRVLSDEEISQLVELAGDLERRFDPPRDSRGDRVPWDVEFGFLQGELWLFQIRPLASDPRLHSLAGLAALDRPARERGDRRVDLQAPPLCCSSG